MVTDVEARKRQEMFSKLDTNKDGNIDESDIREHITSFLTKYNVPSDSAKAKKLFKSGEQIWQELGHKTGGGKQVISQDDYVQSLDAGLVERTYISMNGVFFDILDADQDGRVTEDELVNAMKQDGLAPDNVRKAFQKLDRDNDGGITREEWDQATREMLLSSDPNSAGSILAGI
ncbi:EF-hand domain-containing protein [Actinokineospora sp. 24-640]